MEKIFKILLSAVIALSFTSCHSIDDDRLPPAPVRLNFNTVADWNLYGNPAALQYVIFIKEQRIPANYNYSAISETGYGGILLVGDAFGMPIAYDLACPVEMRKDTMIKVDTEKNEAYCPNCGSRFDIFANYGSPLSGKAAELGYGLQKYYVGAGAAGEYMVITRK